MTGEKKYLFGPVPSRRLGISLGVDIVPMKTCTMNCAYCQLGSSEAKTTERKDYAPVEDILSELKKKLSQPLKADYITISGSGEPTLNSRLGELIKGIKKLTAIPVAVLTNGTLLYDPGVRNDCAKADVVLPSLDAGDEQTFKKINHPHKDISFKKLVDGLCAFRRQFKGQIWLEVFFSTGLNTSREQIEKIKSIIERIRPDKIQLNTAVRPAAEKDMPRLDRQQLAEIAVQLGENVEVIADTSIGTNLEDTLVRAEDVLAMLKRRPCSLRDICAGLGLAVSQTMKYTDCLLQQRKIIAESKDGTIFFKAV